MEKAYCVIMTTVANKEDACRLTAILLKQQLAACVQHMPIESYYAFENRECTEEEILILIKTRHELYHKIEVLMTDEHPYKVPELLMLPVKNGHKDYLDWVDQSVGFLHH